MRFCMDCGQPVESGSMCAKCYDMLCYGPEFAMPEPDEQSEKDWDDIYAIEGGSFDDWLDDGGPENDLLDSTPMWGDQDE